MGKSTYQSKSRMAKATPLQKSVSKLQRNLNRRREPLVTLRNKIRYYKVQLSQFHRLVEWALKEKKLTKLECSKFMKPSSLTGTVKK